MTPQEIRDKIISVIIVPLTELLFVAAFIVFAWGIVQFMRALSEGTDPKQGKSHMLWGIIGMFIMVAARAIIQMVLNTFGATLPN